MLTSWCNMTTALHYAPEELRERLPQRKRHPGPGCQTDPPRPLPFAVEWLRLGSSAMLLGLLNICTFPSCHARIGAANVCIAATSNIKQRRYLLSGTYHHCKKQCKDKVDISQMSINRTKEYRDDDRHIQPGKDSYALRSPSTTTCQLLR